jgi:hypothetical protein
MQSYGEFGLIPRNIANSSQTCVDKRPKNRQIKEIGRKVVQKVRTKKFQKHCERRRKKTHQNLDD